MLLQFVVERPKKCVHAGADRHHVEKDFLFAHDSFSVLVAVCQSKPAQVTVLDQISMLTRVSLGLSRVNVARHRPDRHPRPDEFHLQDSRANPQHEHDCKKRQKHRQVVYLLGYEQQRTEQQLSHFLFKAYRLCHHRTGKIFLAGGQMSVGLGPRSPEQNCPSPRDQ